MDTSPAFSPILAHERHPVRVRDHDRRAFAVAAHLIARIVDARPGTVVEHVGSTAVAGLPGKGVIDLLVAAGARPGTTATATGATGLTATTATAPTAPTGPAATDATTHSGATHGPTPATHTATTRTGATVEPDGRTGADEVPAIVAALLGLGFQRQTGPDPLPPERPMLVGAIDHDGTRYGVHVHVVPAHLPEATELLAFRDALRADPAMRAAYAARKHAIVSGGATDSREYSQVKGDWVRAELDRLARLAGPGAAPDPNDVSDPGEALVPDSVPPTP